MMVVFFVGEFVTGVALAIYQHDIEFTVKKNMETLFLEYNNPNSSQTKRLVDTVHQNLHCCGVHSYMDW